MDTNSEVPNCNSCYFLSCMYFNSRSICNKLDELHHLVYEQNLDIVFICETWLHTGITDGLIDPRGCYSIFRRDRPCCRGGGVCIMVSKYYKAAEVEVDLHCGLELIGVDINISDTKIRLIIAYRPPGVNTEMIAYTDELCKQLKLMSNTVQPVFLVGDFNCPDVNWSAFEAPNDSVQNVFSDFVCETGFVQLVAEPTHNKNVLDLVFSNEPLLVSDLTVEPPFSTSDHDTVRFSVSVPSTVQTADINHQCTTNETQATRKYLWNKADYDSIAAHLMSIDWDLFLTAHLDADSIWHGFCDILQSTFVQFVPTSVTRVADKFRQTGMKFPASIRNLIVRKRCLWRLKRAFPGDEAIADQYKRITSLCRKTIRDYVAEKEKRVIDSENLGCFYKYVNSKLTCKSGVGALKTADGSLLSNDSEKAELLNDYFASVCTADNGIMPSAILRAPDGIKLENVHFSPEVVARTIAKIKPNTSPGGDGLPPLVIKKLARCLSTPLSSMFTSFLSVGKLPSEWKTAVVTPIYKSGLASDCSNYRPVSLTSVICKIMERIIANDVLVYLRKNNLLSRAQHGFLSKRSTVTNLLECLSDWTLGIKCKYNTDVIYIDYAKAFDTVCHSKLLCKLSAIGIQGSLLKWIECFLSGRTQKTRVGDSYSTSKLLTSGVIQGSCLGPLLFLVYINDLSQVFSGEVKCKLFADDVKLYSEIHSSSDCFKLQEALDKIASWSEAWQLNISGRKCARLTVGGRTLPTQVDYTVSDHLIQNVNEHRDLGIYVDHTVKFKTHIHHVVAKARRRASLILKCFTSRDPRLLMRAFITYVRPVLEYASSIWSPTAVGLIDLLESVQRRFTKRLPGYYTLSYRDRLSMLNIDSLEVRRLYLDLVLVYKIIFGLIDFDSSKLFKMNTNPTRGHPYKILQEHGIVDVRRNFFALRVVRVWNSLPPSVVNFTTLNVFKRSLRNVVLTLYTRF